MFRHLPTSILLTCSSVLICTSPSLAETPPMALELAAPIATWDEGVPLGNGLTGGLLWGGGNTINLSLDRGDAVIAHAFFPPPNGNSAAGDVHFSADFNWVDDATDSIIDDDYDLQTVALHELGHALGLDHSSEPGSIMQPFYSGGQRTLGVDDVDCIRSLYGGGGGACDGGNAVASWDDPAELTLSVMPENSVVEDGAGLASSSWALEFSPCSRAAG